MLCPRERRSILGIRVVNVIEAPGTGLSPQGASELHNVGIQESAIDHTQIVPIEAISTADQEPLGRR